jgi:hypothetical protein
LQAVKKPTNILVLGAFGLGKSSFLNNILSAFDAKEEAIVSGKPEHGTRQLKKYDLTKNLSLWDCYGISVRNFDGILLDRILDGRYKSGKSMEIGISNEDPHLTRQDSRNMIHNVIFIVAANDIKGNKDLQDQLSTFKTLLIRKDTTQFWC